MGTERTSHYRNVDKGTQVSAEEAAAKKLTDYRDVGLDLALGRDFTVYNPVNENRASLLEWPKASKGWEYFQMENRFCGCFGFLEAAKFKSPHFLEFTISCAIACHLFMLREDIAYLVDRNPEFYTRLALHLWSDFEDSPSVPNAKIYDQFLGRVQSAFEEFNTGIKAGESVQKTETPVEKEDGHPDWFWRAMHGIPKPFKTHQRQDEVVLSPNGMTPWERRYHYLREKDETARKMHDVSMNLISAKADMAHTICPCRDKCPECTENFNVE